MVNKQENICDGCGKRIANGKCCICKKDLCSYCRRPSFDLCIRSIDVYQQIGEVTLCKECKQKLVNKIGKEELMFDEEFKDRVSGEIGGYLIKRLMMESL